jgi:hypothetical protein
VRTCRLLICALGLGFVSVVQAQAPVLGGDKLTLQRLQAMKEQNQHLLEKQAATILKLEEMAKAAEQLKVFTKRS